ncbi:MAG: response regulator [Candidatus Rokuibacteriota bacterium]
MTDQPLVLLVDDFQDNREMYALFLHHAGFRVAEAGNGHEALDQAFALVPDVIVMDLSLPGLDGWEATRRLKRDRRTRHIPVLALTSHALEGFSEGAKAAGCDGFVTKPCLPEQLVAEIHALLDGARKPESRTSTQGGA